MSRPASFVRASVGLWARARGVVALLGALVGLLLGAPSAAQETVTIDSVDLEMSARFPWPARLAKGYEPIFVRVVNRGARTQLATVEVGREGWRFEHRVSRDVALAPGETLELELFAPAFEQGWGARQVVTLSVLSESRRIQSPNDLGGSNPAEAVVLVVSEEQPSAEVLLAWSSLLSGEVSAGPPTASATETVQRHTRRGLIDSLVISSMGSPGAALPAVSIAAVRADELPARFEPYTSLDAVVVDTRDPVDAGALAPALSAARLGATLAFLGPEARRAALSIPELAAWMEPRFLREHNGAEVYTFGHGRLFVGKSPTFLAPGDAEELDWLLDGHPTFVPNPDDPPLFFRAPLIPGLEDLPYRFFVVLLIGFAVLIGPVNFVLVKRSGRPAWLVLTIPGLALLSSALILAYGFFYQGVDLKLAARTLTVLDQRAHRSDTLALRAFFAGLAPVDGLRPGLGTACFPGTNPSSDLERLYLIDLSESPVLRGEFLPVRRPATQLVISERAARARLAWRPAPDGGDAHLATNGFEVELEELYLFAGDGGVYGWNMGGEQESLLPGAECRLERLELAPELGSRLFPLWDHPWLAAPPRGTYIARLGTNPFEDGCGLEPDQEQAEHLILGVLGDEPESDS